MAIFYGMDLEPLYIDGLYGIATFRDVSIDKVLAEVVERFPLNIAHGCRVLVKEFYADTKYVGSRQVSRAQQRVAEIAGIKHDIPIPRPRQGPPPVPRRLLYP